MGEFFVGSGEIGIVIIFFAMLFLVGRKKGMSKGLAVLIFLAFSLSFAMM